MTPSNYFTCFYSFFLPSVNFPMTVLSFSTEPSSIFSLSAHKTYSMTSSMTAARSQIFTFQTQKHSLWKTFLQRRQGMQPSEQCVLQVDPAFLRRERLRLGLLLAPAPWESQPVSYSHHYEAVSHQQSQTLDAPCLPSRYIPAWVTTSQVSISGTLHNRTHPPAWVTFCFVKKSCCFTIRVNRTWPLTTATSDICMQPTILPRTLGQLPAPPLLPPPKPSLPHRDEKV